MSCEAQEWNAHQRAIKVKTWLDNGERLRMAEIARRLCMSHNGAKKIVISISILEPYAEIDGEWQRIKQ